MADRKISDLTALTTPAAGDYLPIIDISEPLAANKNKRITIEELLRGVPDGTAGAPGFAFESDPDSGLYRTGENGVALSTGGTGRLFVDASGNVGVGTSTAPGKVSIGLGDLVNDGLSLYYNGGGTNETVAKFHANTTTGQVTLGGTSANYFTTLFAGGTERLRITSTGQLSHIGAGSTGSPAVSFNGSAPSNSLVITSAGLVGIGTSSPGSLLSLYAGASSEYFRGGGNGVTTRDLVLSASTGTNAGDTHTINASGSTGRLILSTASSPRMTVDSSGRVGIGTSVPDVDFHVSNADTARIRLENRDTTGSVAQSVGVIEFEGNDGGTGAAGVRANINAVYEGVDGATALAFGTAADGASVSEKVRIDRNGRVGIGTTPVVDLDVAPAASTATFRIHARSNTTPIPAIELVRGTNTTFGADGYGDYRIKNDAGNLAFEYGDTGVTTERARIDSSGRLLVGTSTSITAPDAVGANRDGSLQLAGNLLATTMQGNHFFNVSGTGPLYQFTKSNTNTIGSHTIVALNDRLGTFQWSGSDGTNYIPAAQIYAQVDASPGVNDMPGRLVFSTTADGASSPSPRMTITSAGLVGIGTSSPWSRLSVNMDANNMRFGTAIDAGGNPAIDLYRWQGTGTNYKSARIVCLTDGSIGILSATANSTDFSAQSFTDRVRIDSSGRVGIGTTGPNYELHVNASDALSAIQLTNTSTGTTASDGFLIYNNGVNATISNEESGYLRFQTAGSERAQIDSSGRLLVGTSSAETASLGALFQIQATSGIASALIKRNDNGALPSYLYLGKSRGTTVNSTTIVQNGDSLGAIRFTGADGSTEAGAIAAQITAAVDGTPGADDMPGRLVFSTTADGASSPTERMRISSAGVQNISSSSNGHSSYLTAAAGTTTYAYRAVHSHTAGNFGTGTVSFYVWSNGDVVNTNNSYGAISDIKLKENIVNANSQWSDIKALQVRNYNLKEGQTHTQIGLIAQEVELVSPGLVSESPDRDEDGNDLGTVTKSVNYSVLYMKAVKALQEAMDRIEILEAKVAALEGA